MIIVRGDAINAPRTFTKFFLFNSFHKSLDAMFRSSCFIVSFNVFKTLQKKMIDWASHMLYTDNSMMSFMNEAEPEIVRGSL